MLLHNLCDLLWLKVLYPCGHHMPAVDPPRHFVDLASSLWTLLHLVHVALVWEPFFLILNHVSSNGFVQKVVFDFFAGWVLRQRL